MFAIGMAGKAPRIIMDALADDAALQLREGEVAVEVAGPGDWLIAADGKTAAIRPLTEADLWQALRVRRDNALALTDWTQLPDVPEQTQLKWRPYRQALRDLTETTINPDQAVWPEEPA